MKIVDGCRHVLHMREEIQKLMSRCENLSNDMEEVTSRYGRTVDMDKENDGIVDQPSLIPNK